MITTQAQIIELEERLRQAMLGSDVVELDALIAPELLFTNHLGQLVSKQEDLDAHRSGQFKFTELTPSERQIQLNNGFTVVSVLMHIVGSYVDLMNGRLELRSELEKGTTINITFPQQK
ncbi:DUF4440 domain-containing protein [Chamaesiphon sp. OTE_20_metabat_361]|uniref:DUF4440 domain-containing protein n=1 Tax=Chamaesiphon sp. OTE_20_metabat_361 TaxID=2964689 RepID=UPI00286A2712|nr:DUF4440 domain-containing protein [Chamaesiphon sp. OTE_20_metabat_361]